MRAYVYEHFDPRTGEVRYVGKGTGGRAWSVARSGSRSLAHFEWLTEIQEHGFTPDQFVRVIARGLSNKEALRLELLTIKAYGYDRLFNSTMSHGLMLNAEQLQRAELLRREGLSHAVIAERIGTSTMTVYRALTGQTKGYRLSEQRSRQH